jgi:hypothetical protein
MQRYYFDIVVGTRRIPDQDGQELPDNKVARERAYQEIRSVLRQHTVDLLDAKDCHIEVNDQARRFCSGLMFQRPMGLLPADMRVGMAKGSKARSAAPR